MKRFFSKEPLPEADRDREERLARVFAQIEQTDHAAAIVGMAGRVDLSTVPEAFDE